jgi:L,D-peptidoglycan transpeptidase YkuD (ErfK/YbiS/YcfS/YnhG family)
MSSTESDIIRVTPDGTVHFQDHAFSCSLGRGGMDLVKVEGDGVTPIGSYPLRRVLYRSDRIKLPETGLPASAIGELDGWCDDPYHPRYNQPVSFPLKCSAEHLWRPDHLYDLIVVIGHNDAPVIPGAGSAIFMHVAKSEYAPTEGCVAFAVDDLLAILAKCSDKTMISLGE